jgi:large subunit ribosomal protein L9
VKLILREDVRDLGRSGELVEVKDGYGRNYLLPRKLAVPATEGNLRDFKKRIAAAREREVKERETANQTADRLRGQRVVLIHRVAEGTQRLHGSVTSAEIAEAISALAGHTIDRRDVDVSRPIRTLGEYQVSLKIMRGISVPIRVLVADREPVEEPPVEEQAETAEVAEAPAAEEAAEAAEEEAGDEEE